MPLKGFENEFPGVYQDFVKDIFEALESGILHLKKYQRLFIGPKRLRVLRFLNTRTICGTINIKCGWRV